MGGVLFSFILVKGGLTMLRPKSYDSSGGIGHGRIQGSTPAVVCALGRVRRNHHEHTRRRSVVPFLKSSDRTKQSYFLPVHPLAHALLPGRQRSPASWRQSLPKTDFDCNARSVQPWTLRSLPLLGEMADLRRQEWVVGTTPDDHPR